MQRNDPRHQEHLSPVDGDSPLAPGNRFHSAPLSRPVMAFLRRAQAQHQRRRKVFRAGHLRVCLDGDEHCQWDPRIDVCEPLIIPLTASYLEIFGDDGDGALLLAVFPLPELEVVEDDGPQHLSVILEGGQTVAIQIALGDGPEGRQYVIQMTYADATEVETQGAELALPSSATAALYRSEEQRAGESRELGRDSDQRVSQPL